MSKIKVRKAFFGDKYYSRDNGVTVEVKNLGSFLEAFKEESETDYFQKMKAPAKGTERYQFFRNSSDVAFAAATVYLEE